LLQPATSVSAISAAISVSILQAISGVSSEQNREIENPENAR
jgi:hypothetical protein